MSRIARYGKAVAREGHGQELADLLLAAAAELAGDPGCELYLVNRQTGQPDTIWVTELWRDQQALDASLEKIRGSDSVSAAMALVESWEMIELDLLGEGSGVRSAVAIWRRSLGTAENRRAKTVGRTHFGPPSLRP